MTHLDGNIPGERAAKRRPARHRDGGFTFVEVVVTIVLVGVVVLPILAAVRSSISAAAVSKAAAEVETVLVNAADGVNGTDPILAGCDLRPQAVSAVTPQGWDASTVEVDSSYLETDGSWSIDFDEDLGCPPDALLTGVLRVRITVSHPVESVTRTLEVVAGEF